MCQGGLTEKDKLLLGSGMYGVLTLSNAASKERVLQPGQRVWVASQQGLQRQPERAAQCPAQGRRHQACGRDALGGLRHAKHATVCILELVHL